LGEAALEWVDEYGKRVGSSKIKAKGERQVARSELRFELEFGMTATAKNRPEGRPHKEIGTEEKRGESENDNGAVG
jgi:hypothetical protein